MFPLKKLRVAVQVSLPSATTVFVLVLVSYFFVISGIMYDLIQAPPGMGLVQVSDRLKLEVFI